MRWVAVFLVALGVAAAPAARERGDRKAEPVYALVSGTIFRDSGLALPGAEITLTPDGNSAKGAKRKKLSAASDARGEFAFRLPAAPARYLLRVKAAGYKEDQKPVVIEAEDRIDLFFHLEPAPGRAESKGAK